MDILNKIAKLHTFSELVNQLFGTLMKEEEIKFVKPKNSKSKFITVGKRTKKVRKVAKKVIKKK